MPTDYFCQLEHFSVLSLSGDDAARYLQGQVTNNVEQLTESQSQLGCHCDFKGKAWNNFYCIHADNTLRLIGNGQGNRASLPELKKYAVFSKVEVEVPPQLQVFGGYGEQLEETLAGIFGSLPEQHLHSRSTGQGTLVCLKQQSKRYLIVASPALSSELTKTLTSITHNSQHWRALDIQDGLAFISEATSNQFVPQMLNMQALGAIDFQKGCYMGQEVVARTKYLGKNKRACFILQGQPGKVHEGDSIEMQIGEHWRKAGTVINHAQDQEQQWLLAVLPNDLPHDSLLRLKDQPETIFTIHPLPYSLDE